MVYLAIILFVLVTGSLAFVALENSALEVHLQIWTWQSPNVPLGLLLLVAFILGACLFYLISVASAWQDGRELRVLHGRLTELEQALATARASSVQPLLASEPNGGAPVVPMPGLPPISTNSPPDISDMPTLH